MYIVSGYVYQSNTGNKRITINAHYFHQKKVMSIAFTGVSVSFLPAGVSMGFSSKEQESYQLIGSGISTVVNVNNYSYK